MTFAQTLSWQGYYDNAHQKALHTHKPLLVLVVKREDPKTQHILREVFMNQPYIGALNQKVVSVIVMYEGSVSYPVEMFYATEFPALFLVNENELFLHQPLYGREITRENIKKIVTVLP